jgi:hypothetical protein
VKWSENKNTEARSKKNIEAKRSEKKNLRSEKKQKNLCEMEAKRIPFRLVLLSNEKKFEAKPAHPILNLTLS